MSRFKKLSKSKKSKDEGIEGILADRIRQGKAIPIIGERLINDLIFESHDNLTAAWAEEYEQPDTNSLPQMTQFHSVLIKAENGADDLRIKEVYLNEFLVNLIAEMADEDLLEELDEDPDVDNMTYSEITDRLELSNLTGGTKNPLLLLAEMPFPIYLTTSTSTFLEMALKQAGRSPRTEICYWNEYLNSIPSLRDDEEYTPSVEEPLVYHLHGVDQHPSSLVLTEDDHLDFLTSIAKGWNSTESWDRIYFPVKQALTDSSLVMVGYKLDEWDFRVVFRGLIGQSMTQRRPMSVAIQLEGDELQQKYFKNYIQQQGNFDVFWGNPLEFITKIWKAWKG